MSRLSLQRFMYAGLACLLLGLSGIPVNAQEVIWERNARDGALQATPSWLEAGNERGVAYGEIDGEPVLVIASRTGGANLRVVNALTGEDVTSVAFDMTGVTGGLFAVQDVDFSEDGKIVVNNMTTNASVEADPFKIYVFEPTGGAFIASYAHSTTGAIRLGDKATVVGSWADGTLAVYATQAGSSTIHRFSTDDQGDNWTAATVTLTADVAANATIPANSSVARTANGDILVNGNGSAVRRYNSDGEYQVGQNIGSTGSMSGVRAFTAGDSEFVALYAFRGASASDPRIGYVMVYNVDDPDSPVLVGESPKMGSADNANTASGDVTYRVNDDGSWIVYGLATSQGLIAFGTAPEDEVELTVTPIADVYALEVGTEVMVEGIVTRAHGNETRLQDLTGGISTFGNASSMISTMVAAGDYAQGDSVRITGLRGVFNELVQISDITGIEILSRENELPEPVLVTLAELRDNGDEYMSQLVRVENITINAGGATTFAGNTTYEITDGSGVTPGQVEFRVPNAINTTINGEPIPTVAFTYVGVTSFFNGAHRLYPQSASDVIVPPQPLAGSYVIPQGTNAQGFESLAEAFSALNELGVSGPVTLYVADDLDETDSALFLSNVETSASNSITIRPAPGTSPTVTVSGGNTAATESAGAGIAIHNTPWVTVDGSADEGSGQINLSVVYDGTAGANGVFSIIGTSSHVTIKNTSITYENASASATGIRVRRDNAGTVVPVDLLFYNNIIGSFDSPFKDGVALFGAGDPLLRVEAQVIDNDIYATHRGITTFFVTENIYDDNLIILTGEFENPAWYGGIYIAGAADGTEVTANRIYTTGANFTTAGRYVAGIVVNLNADETLIANNYFATSDDFESLGTTDDFRVLGIAFQRGDGVDDYYIVHNSFLSSEAAAADGRTTANIGYVGTGGFGSFQYLRNNIFANEAGVNLYWPVTNVPSLDSDFNNFLHTGDLAIIGDEEYADLAAWQGLGLDANSVSHGVEFVSDIDLTLTGSSLGDDMLRGTFVDFVDSDINGFARNPEAPYMGAFESDVTLTDVESMDQVPVAFALNQNFPNPFNPTTTISYELPTEAHVELRVYTVTGQLVTTLVNEARPAGQHQVNFDASRLASGVYVYRIIAGDFMQTQKMTLIK